MLEDILDFLVSLLPFFVIVGTISSIAFKKKGAEPKGRSAAKRPPVVPAPAASVPQAAMPQAAMPAAPFPSAIPPQDILESEPGKEIAEDTPVPGPGGVAAAARHLPHDEPLPGEEGSESGEGPGYHPCVFTETADSPTISHARPALNAAAMRQAIVTSEILGKPVSMRRRRF